MQQLSVVALVLVLVSAWAPLARAGINAKCRSKWECLKRGHYFHYPFKDCVKGKCATCRHDGECKPHQYCDFLGWAVTCQDRPKGNATAPAKGVNSAPKVSSTASTITKAANTTKAATIATAAVTATVAGVNASRTILATANSTAPKDVKIDSNPAKDVKTDSTAPKDVKTDSTAPKDVDKKKSHWWG